MTVDTLALVLVGLALARLLDRGLLAAQARGWIYYRRRKAASGSVTGAVLGPAFDLLKPSRQIVVQQQEHAGVAPATDDQAHRRDPDQGG